MYAVSNNEHWDTFKRISMDVTSLSSSEKDIQTIIGKINKGFATCNFVGVIQRIEMKMEESSNRVVNVLHDIQKYYKEYGYDLTPETNLFSSEKEPLIKEEAIKLLRDFIKEIHAYRYDNIRLYFGSVSSFQPFFYVVFLFYRLIPFQYIKNGIFQSSLKIILCHNLPNVP